jgi:hypothetical protein
VRHLLGIRALNYRVIRNGRLDYDVRQSSYTSRQSTNSLLQSSAAASLRFKSGDLNSLHLDRTSLSFVFHEEENESVALSSKNSAQKHRTKNEKKSHHHNAGHKYNNGQHKRKCSQHAHDSVTPCQSRTFNSEASAQLEGITNNSTPGKSPISAKASGKTKVSTSISIYVQF